MDVSTIREVFDRIVLWGCAGAFMALGFGCAGVWLSRMPLRVRKAAKRFGWPTVVMLGAMMVFATIEGTPTNEDKQRWQQQQQEEDDENNAYGMMYFGGMALDGLASSGLSSDGLTSAGDETTSDDENESASRQLSEIGLDAVATPSVRSLTSDDYASGVALARIGTNEVWDFSAPVGAEICTDWLEFGAERDWFRTNFTNDWAFAFGTNTVDALTVYSWGMARPTATNAATFFAPMQTRLGIVPVANWEQLAATDRPSQFWQYLTPSNTFVMTWQNVLLDRASDRPVSFQAEFEENGDVTFRYDLSRLADGLVTNLIVGISNDGVGRVFNALHRSTTSLKWVHLDPTRPYDNDPDNDGVTTEDEIFIYGTDPYRADTDQDGLSDGQEVNETSTDPLDPHSVDPRYPDGVAVVLGDVDPFSYPEGSTNTVWEHVFYTGTTNAPVAYPQSTDGTAVLRVTVSGSGSGELIVGDQIVPLLGASPASSPARAAARGARSGDGLGTPLFVQMTRGESIKLYLRGDGDLSVGLDSDDFAFGMLPSWSSVIGFVNFPNTKAETPCIHDFNARRKRVSLPVRKDAELLTCSWQGTGMDVVIENEAPRSALITASFSASTSRDITYTLSHPFYLFGQTTYGQKVKFCPKPKEPDPDDPDPEPDPTPPWFDDGEGDDSDDDDDNHEERWCCQWGTCCNGDGTCSCGCDCCGSQDDGGWDEDEVPEETCPQHHVDYEQCASLHYDAYTNATWRAEEYRDVLKIRDPLDYDSISLPCPDSYHKCCDCPDHCTNYVAVAYKSCRLSLIDEHGDNFRRAVDPCTVRVAGVYPSASVGDATLGFVTNGVVFRTYNYTVLGVGISKPSGPPLALYNNLSRTMGVPMTITTNVNHALQLNLLTKVRLPTGNVQFSIDADEDAQFTVWTYDYRRNSYRRLLDTDGRSVVNLPISAWRKLVGTSSDSYSPETPIYITSAAKGAATLRFGYWCMIDGKVVQDWCSQEITSVEPPLLPDYNRDGRADQMDVDAHLRGDSFWYWQNQDTLRGEFIADGASYNVLNTSDNEVNGPLDLVNFFPVALRVSKLIDHWGAGVSCYIESDAGEGSFKFCFADVGWSAIGSIQTNDVRTVDDQRLCHADLVPMPENGWRIPPLTLGGFSEDSGALVAEAVSSYVSLRLTFRIGDDVLYSYALPMTIVPVKEMYSWINGRHLSGEEESRQTEYRVRAFEKALVFLHGANVSEAAAEKWGDSIFKRLWLSGMKADFYNVDWRSDMGLTGANYQQNASNAFEVASQLAPVIASIPGEKVVMAHSLGNMVVSSMIQDHGLSVARYLMCNSAVPAEAYDSSPSLRVPQLVHPDWEDYPTNTWTACWHSLFDGYQNDDRRLLGWPGRFASVAQYAVNFYSTGDEVLELSQENDLNVFTGVTGGFGHLSWHKQELFKGRASLTSGLGGTDWSGWGFHKMVVPTATFPVSVVKYSPTEAAGLTEQQIRDDPVFNPYPLSMTNSVIPLLVRAAHLTQGIPALVPPTGTTDLSSLLDRESCFDLNSPERISRPNGWPVRSSYSSRWLHSDLKDIAYYYNFKFFDAIVGKGVLK